MCHVAIDKKGETVWPPQCTITIYYTYRKILVIFLGFTEKLLVDLIPPPMNVILYWG